MNRFSWFSLVDIDGAAWPDNSYKYKSSYPTADGSTCLAFQDGILI